MSGLWIRRTREHDEQDADDDQLRADVEQVVHFSATAATKEEKQNASTENQSQQKKPPYRADEKDGYVARANWNEHCQV